MKLTALIMLFMCGTAMAEVPTIKASKVTCQELKVAVEKYGAVNVKKKSLGIFSSTKFVQHKANCSTDQYTRTYSFKTKDQRDCIVGEWCENPYVYSGGTDTTHDWPRDHDTDTGPRYDPPSRDDNDRGPRYDPPSRDDNDRGPRYDPPSRDDNERGPRYCPNC